ncbi:hypothetical protein TWF225_001737 [Orbilia oligospora]|uniref:Uncharacterized protein n=1 Tax=Orbilia oligospora TaxID=2813651 RepID=A0A7C8UEL6_ORBOL|nr:hypothetical protein TWF225_001737 [Orbilia oligospora]KAF3204332.1 hypothetical protein TWF679_009893 [Orbilia oligospora]KAF3206198.1 hypothetical protein TWF106_000892 [Orbilia oligospora]KAF3233794.1 hypothetical protein TWF217_004537 [Orbilia oligospora]KAF3243932.1 hypothetical protein TWF128_009869 [Orbilia oligospora]
MANLNRYRRSHARASSPDLTDLSNKDSSERNNRQNSAPDSAPNPNPPPPTSPRPPPSIIRGPNHTSNGHDSN